MLQTGKAPDREMKKISDLFTDEEKKQLSYLGSIGGREVENVVGCNIDVLVFAITAHRRDQNHNDQSCSAERLGITPQGITEIRGVTILPENRFL